MGGSLEGRVECTCLYKEGDKEEKGGEQSGEGGEGEGEGLCGLILGMLDLGCEEKGPPPQEAPNDNKKPTQEQKTFADLLRGRQEEEKEKNKKKGKRRPRRRRDLDPTGCQDIRQCFQKRGGSPKKRQRGEQ